MECVSRSFVLSQWPEYAWAFTKTWQFAVHIRTSHNYKTKQHIILLCWLDSDYSHMITHVYSISAPVTTWNSVITTNLHGHSQKRFAAHTKISRHDYKTKQRYSVHTNRSTQSYWNQHEQMHCTRISIGLSPQICFKFHLLPHVGWSYCAILELCADSHGLIFMHMCLHVQFKARDMYMHMVISISEYVRRLCVPLGICVFPIQSLEAWFVCFVAHHGLWN